MESPAFQFYPTDFLADESVQLMDNQAIGCYIRLLSHCWIEGSIPADVTKIAKLCRENDSAMAELWAAISPCFVEHTSKLGRLVNPRLEKERQKQERYRQERSESGAKGAKSRWDKGFNRSSSRNKSDDSANGSATTQLMANDSSSSSSSSSNGVVEEEEAPQKIDWVKWHEQKFAVLPSQKDQADIGALADRGVTQEFIIFALQQAIDNKARFPVSAARKFLGDQFALGVGTVMQYEALEAERQAKEEERRAGGANSDGRNTGGAGTAFGQTGAVGPGPGGPAFGRNQTPQSGAGKSLGFDDLSE